MMTKNREYRLFSLQGAEFRQEGDGLYIEGYAVVFNSQTVLYEDERGNKYYEEIDRGALDKTDLQDVVLNVNHEGKPLARTRNKTLELSIDDKGLKIRANLAGTAQGRELFEEIKGGYLDKMSFAFVYDKYNYDKKARKMTITGIKRLYDVSVVTFPAYDATTVNARSTEFLQAEAAKERAEARKTQAETVKRKLIIAKLKG